MKKLLIILVSVFAFAGLSFGQTDETTGCPKLEITGPSGLTKPGETADYSINVETEGTDLKFEYIWSVSSGEIISGRNTPSITVRFGNQGVTTTVEIKGLPEGCPNMASEAGGCGLLYLAERIDRFEGPITLADRPRFEKILEALRNDPDARVSVFVGYRTARELKEKKRIVVKSWQSLTRASKPDKRRGRGRPDGDLAGPARRSRSPGGRRDRDSVINPSSAFRLKLPSPLADGQKSTLMTDLAQFRLKPAILVFFTGWLKQTANLKDTSPVRSPSTTFKQPKICNRIPS